MRTRQLKEMDHTVYLLVVVIIQNVNTQEKNKKAKFYYKLATPQ